MPASSKLALAAGTLPRLAPVAAALPILVASGCGLDDAHVGDGTSSDSGGTDSSVSATSSTGGTAGTSGAPNVCGDGIPNPENPCFERSVVVSNPAPQGPWLTLGAFVNSGWLDLAYHETDDTVTVLDFESADKWETDVQLDISSGARLLAARTDSESRHDILVASMTSETLQRLTITNGEINLTSGPTAPHYPGIVIDVDGDGVDEVMFGQLTISDVDAPGARLWEWNGETYDISSDLYPISGCGCLAAGTVADFNEDGFMDVAAVGEMSPFCAPPEAGDVGEEPTETFDRISVLLYNAQTASFDSSSFFAKIRPRTLVAARMSDSGMVDLLVGPKSVEVEWGLWSGRGDGTFSLTSTFLRSDALLPIDIEQNGRDELLYSAQGGAIIWSGDVDDSGLALGMPGTPVRVDDVNRDGFSDVLVRVSAGAGAEDADELILYLANP